MRFAMRFVLAMIAVPVVAILLWIVLPDGPVSVALLAIAILAIVGGAIGLAMKRRADLETPPPASPCRVTASCGRSGTALGSCEEGSGDAPQGRGKDEGHAAKSSARSAAKSAGDAAKSAGRALKTAAKSSRG